MQLWLVFLKKRNATGVEFQIKYTIMKSNHLNNNECITSFQYYCNRKDFRIIPKNIKLAERQFIRV